MARDGKVTASFTRPNGLVKVKMIPIRSALPQGVRNNIGALETLGTFYLNPTSWSDTKSTRWVKQDVPGLSDPHQQWVSGGARTISFEALVTNDLADGHVAQKNGSSALVCNSLGKTSVVNRIGGIAAQIFNIGGISLDSAIEARGQNPDANSTLNLDITNKLNYYRSLVYPNLVSQSNGTMAAPYPVRLSVGTTLGRRVKHAKFVVDSVSIQITKQLADLTPIEARVTFTLTELTDKVLSSDSNILTDQ